MAAAPGRNWILYISPDGGVNYTKVAGLRTRAFTVGNTNVDVTNADSVNRFRELLGGAGVQNLDIDFAGIYQNDAGAKMLYSAAMTSTISVVRLVTNGIQIDMSALIDSYKSDGPYNEGATFEGKLLSSGNVTTTLS